MNDIDILEELVNGFDNLISYKQKQAIETLIAENKELKEENKKLTDEYMIQKHLINAEFLDDYIPKSKVEEKIDELEKIKQKDEVDEFGIHSRDWWVADIIQEQFKELLNERNNTDEH